MQVNLNEKILECEGFFVQANITNHKKRESETEDITTL